MYVFLKLQFSCFRGLCSQLCFLLLTAEAHGLPCSFNGQVYQHGEDFQPVCQHQCTCMNGVVGCMPLCPHQVPLPLWRCSRPRLARLEGRCCEEWVCDDDNRISEELDELTYDSLPKSQPHPNHINTLLQVQPRHPAATGSTTFRGNIAHKNLTKIPCHWDSWCECTASRPSYRDGVLPRVRGGTGAPLFPTNH